MLTIPFLYLPSKNMHRVDTESVDVTNKVRWSLFIWFWSVMELLYLFISCCSFAVSLILSFLCCVCVFVRVPHSVHRWQLTLCFMSQLNISTQWGRARCPTYRWENIYEAYMAMDEKCSFCICVCVCAGGARGFEWQLPSLHCSSEGCSTNHRRSKLQPCLQLHHCALLQVVQVRHTCISFSHTTQTTKQLKTNPHPEGPTQYIKKI